MAGWQVSDFPPAHLNYRGANKVPVQIGGSEPTDADLEQHRAQYPGG